MKKKDLLKSCLYYHGEAKCPFEWNSREHHFWTMEKAWYVNDSEDVAKDDYNTLYLSLEFPDLLREFDIPLGLKATMLNQYTHWNQTSEGFKDYLLNYMMGAPLLKS